MRKKTPAHSDPEALVAIYGVSPLELLIWAVSAQQLPLQQRLDSAKAAAPYCHARLMAQEINVHSTREPTREEIEAELRASGLDPATLWTAH